MARDLDLRAKATLEGGDKVADQLEDIADSAEKVEKPIDLRVTTNLDKALDQLDQLNEQAHADAVAMEALGDAMGPELTGRADMAGVIGELKRLGMTAEEVTANATELGQKLRDIDSPDLGGKLGQSLGTARGEVEKMTQSAGGANSALANMIGNSAQDVGALGGVAGSAGVAIGQMAEYAADATLASEGLGSALGSMAKVAGPIAIMAAAMELIGSVMEARGDAAEAEAQQVDTLTDAYRSGISPAQAYADALRNLGEVTVGLNRNATMSEQGGIIGFLGGLSEKLGVLGSPIQAYGDALGIWGEATADLVPVLSKAGISVDMWSKAVMGGQQAVGDMATALSHTTLSADEQDTVIQGLTDSQEANTASKQNAAAMTTVFGAANADAAKSVEQLAEEQRNAAQAAQDYAGVMASADWQTSTVDAAAQAWQKLGEQQFATANIAAATQAAYDNLGAAIAQNGFTFDLATEAGRANGAQLQELYSSLIPSLSKAFADSDGSMASFRTNMNQLSTETFQQLRDQTDLTDDQIREVMDRLGAFDDSTYQAKFEMLGAEDATYKLGLLSGVLGSLPPDVQRQVTLDIIAGDPVAALERVQASVSGQPAPQARMDIVPGEDTATPAIGEITDAKHEANVNIDGTNDDAVDKVQGVQRKADSTKPIVKVDSDTQQAIATMVLLYVIARTLQPIVTVKAVLGEYPSASSIAAKIGTVRVPVDAYLRSEPRITGAR